jgi:hypothetical protein
LPENSKKICFESSVNVLRVSEHLHDVYKFPKFLQRNMVNNKTYEGAFKEFEENEFGGLTNNNIRQLLIPLLR